MEFTLAKNICRHKIVQIQDTVNLEYFVVATEIFRGGVEWLKIDKRTFNYIEHLRYENLNVTNNKGSYHVV